MFREYVVILEDPVSEEKRDQLVDEAGVYFVFSAKKRSKENGKVSFLLNKLLYIGRSKDVRHRLNNQHHRHQDFLDSCDEGMEPCYYYGSISRKDDVPCTEDDYVRVESALIMDKKPVLNDTADKEFHHDLTCITLKRCDTTANRDLDTGIVKDLPLAFGMNLILVV